MPNAVVYARYSSHSQTEQSIEGQLKAAKLYAAQKGYTVIHEYIDRAKTGRNDNRAEFQQMLSDTAKKQFEIIICWKVDRFGRNREEITFNKYHCKKNGVRVEYVAETLTDTPESVILESVLEGMAEYYSLQLSQNIHRGLLASAEKGQAIGGPIPLGLAIDPKTKKYVIDEKTAPIVRLIFKRAVEGHTQQEIIEELNSMGLKTAKGKPFSFNSIYSVLKNEKYIGVYAYKDLVRIEDGIPAIIDRESYTKAQEVLKMNKRAPASRWTYHEFILTGKLFCGECGAQMAGESGTGKLGKVYQYYSCINKRKKHGCKKQSIKQPWIEDIVLRHTVDILKNDEVLKFITDKTWEFYQRQDETKQKKAAIEQQLSDTETGINSLIKVLESGIISQSVTDRLAALEQQKADLQASLSDLNLVSGLQLTRDHIEYFLTKMRNQDLEDRAVQKRLIETFINSIFVYKEKIVLTFNYSGDGNTVTIKDVEGFVRSCNGGAWQPLYEHLTVGWFKNVFAIRIPLYHNFA